jgi:hypothetical protein
MVPLYWRDAPIYQIDIALAFSVPTLLVNEAFLKCLSARGADTR